MDEQIIKTIKITITKDLKRTMMQIVCDKIKNFEMALIMKIMKQARRPRKAYSQFAKQDLLDSRHLQVILDKPTHPKSLLHIYFVPK